MGVNASVAQISGGIASALAGIIVFQDPTGHIERYPVLGVIVAVTMVITIVMMHFINRDVMERRKMEQQMPGTVSQ